MGWEPCCGLMPWSQDRGVHLGPKPLHASLSLTFLHPPVGCFSCYHPIIATCKLGHWVKLWIQWCCLVFTSALQSRMWFIYTRNHTHLLMCNLQLSFMALIYLIPYVCKIRPWFSMRSLAEQTHSEMQTQTHVFVNFVRTSFLTKLPVLWAKPKLPQEQLSLW